MTLSTRFAVAIAASFAALCASAQAPQQTHGESDAFAAPGVALAWGALGSAGTGGRLVDIRVSVDPMTYPYVVVVAHERSGSRERVLASSLTAGLTDLRVPRTMFERYPRTEFRFYGTAKPEPGEAPILVVDFDGVPGTTPEFANEARLDASLTERIVRAKAATK